MATDTIAVPTAKPPGWFNAGMRAALRTPGLQRWLGRAIALITVTGRRTGRPYTTPVTYDRQGSTVVIVTKRFRTWWRNLQTNTEVELRLAGTTHRARAEIAVGDPAALPVFVEFLRHHRQDARAYGITLDGEGRIDEDRAREVLRQLVVITVALPEA